MVVIRWCDPLTLCRAHESLTHAIRSGEMCLTSLRHAPLRDLHDGNGFAILIKHPERAGKNASKFTPVSNVTNAPGNYNHDEFSLILCSKYIQGVKKKNSRLIGSSTNSKLRVITDRLSCSAIILLIIIIHY